MGKPVYYDEDTIFCPYCKNDDFDGYDFIDGDVEQVTCPRCGSEFKYIVEVQYLFDIWGLKGSSEKPTLNNPVKKKVVVRNCEGKHIEEVDAEEIVILGFEEFKFFLYIKNWEWVVFEESTGMHICADDSREAVMERAKGVLADVGKVKTIAAIARWPKISELEREMPEAQP